MKGKRTNRGFEGLAISPDGAYLYAMLQSAMLDEGGTASGTAVAQYAGNLPEQTKENVPADGEEL